MKRVFKFFIAIIVSMTILLSAKSTQANPTDPVKMLEGASIRTEGVQGLRFYATLDESVLANEHGFYVAFGIADLNTLQEAILNAAPDVIVNGKRAFKVPVPGHTPQNEYSIVLMGIPEVGYFDNISVFPYVVQGEQETLNHPEVRSIANVTYKMANAGANINGIVAVDSIINTTRKQVHVKENGDIELLQKPYELKYERLKEEFLKDWNAMFGTEITILEHEAFYLAARIGSLLEYAECNTLAGTNIYAFFNHERYGPKWSWLLDYIIHYDLLDNVVHPGRQANAIKGDGTNGTHILYNAYHLSYSLVNFFNKADEAAISVKFADGTKYDNLKDYNNKIYINLNGIKLYTSGEEILLPPPKPRHGYNFQHYKKGGHTYNAGTTYTLDGEEGVIVADYAPIEYALKFYDGANEMTSLSTTYNIEDAVTLPTPTKDNHTFLGWYNNPELSGTAISGIVAGTTGAINLYAKWENLLTEYTITYNLNGGSWPLVGGEPGYTNRDTMIDDFLNQWHGWLVSKGKVSMSLNDFKHGAGKTSGYDGVYHDSIADLRAVNDKTVNPNGGFVNQAAHHKWVALVDLMDEYTGKVNPAQAGQFWSSNWTARERIKSFVRKTGQGQVQAGDPIYSQIPASLAQGTPGSPLVPPTTYTPASNDITLPNPTKSSDPFIGWYDNANLYGTAITKIVKGSSGNKTFYARYNSSTVIPPDNIKLSEAKAALNVGYASGDSANSVTKNVTLATTGLHGVGVSWATSDASTITTGGVVTRKEAGDTTVTLTATLTVGGLTDTKVFTLVVKKYDPEPEVYTITYHLNGGQFPGYANKNAMIDAFLSDLYNFVAPSENLTTFKHGAGNTSGFNGLWYTNEDYKAKIYAANIQSGNNNYFLSHSSYYSKWKPLADFMVNFVAVNPDQSFWASPYTGCMRMNQYFRNIKPDSNWTDAMMAAMPSGLSANVPYEYNENTPTITLITPTRTGYTFDGWFTANTGGTKVTTIPQGSTGNKVFYARWTQTATPQLIALMNLLKGGHRATLNKHTIRYYGATNHDVTQYRLVNRYLFNDPLSINKSYWLSDSRNNHPNRTATKHWVVIHDTGNTNATAANNASYMVTQSSASWHYTIGNDGVYQSMNENKVAWHAGDGSSYSVFHNTGIAASNPYLRPKMTISGGKWVINGQVTNISCPGSASQLPETGIHPVIINGTYHINDTRVRYSQATAGRIGFDGGNENGIGIETSVRSSDHIWWTWGKTAKLVADILVRRGLLPDRVVFHNNFDGKVCPQACIRSGNINEWLEMIFLEYKVRKDYSNYTISFQSHSNLVNSMGRVTTFPTSQTTITYTITLKDPNNMTYAETLTTVINP